MAKSLLGIRDMQADEIRSALSAAEAFEAILDRDIKKVPTLRGKVLVNMFFEDSTRTRSSFELAGKILSADVINLSEKGSSRSKGESLKDTALTIRALGADFIVVRHACAGVPHAFARWTDVSVINAGDGCGEHPTQAFLDMYTIKKRKGGIENLTVTIVGDILHSRVARSNVYALTKLGARVNLLGPPTLIPAEAEKLGVKVYNRFEEEIFRETDVLYLLRIQLERQGAAFFPTLNEYSLQYGISRRRLERFEKEVLVMHPGPLNRGVEIDADVADGPVSLIADQVRNGVAVRMAVLYLLAGRGA